jgi:hypothetical protein
VASVTLGYKAPQPGGFSLGGTQTLLVRRTAVPTYGCKAVINTQLTNSTRLINSFVKDTQFRET